MARARRFLVAEDSAAAWGAGKLDVSNVCLCEELGGGSTCHDVGIIYWIGVWFTRIWVLEA